MRNRTMRSIGLLVSLSVLLTLTFSRHVFSWQQPQGNDGNTKSVSNDDASIPEHIQYRIFFHSIYALHTEAEKSGDPRQAGSYRTYLQGTGLDEGQSRKTLAAAIACEERVEAVDQRAKVILDARKAYYRNGEIAPGQSILPPSPELQVLQLERNATILQCRDSLRGAIGDKDFENVRQFVQTKVRASINVTTPNQQ
jgi:hypothetical protein